MKQTSVAERLSPEPGPTTRLRLVEEPDELPTTLFPAAGTLLGIAVSVLFWVMLIGTAFWITSW